VHWELSLGTHPPDTVSSIDYWKYIGRYRSTLSSQAIPSQEGFQRFSFDPEETSRFEIANELWSTMEGTTA
jgi:hypothetical protein